MKATPVGVAELLGIRLTRPLTLAAMKATPVGVAEIDAQHAEHEPEGVPQ